MLKAEGAGVKRLAWASLETMVDESLVTGGGKSAQDDVAAIARIVEQRVSDVAHVGANLVCAPSFEDTLNKRDVAEALNDAIVCDGMLPNLGVLGKHGHLQPVLGVAGDVAAYCSLVFPDVSPNEGVVAATRSLIEELHAEFCLCVGSLCHDKKAARILVDAMDEAHAGVVGVVVGIIAQMPRKSVDESASKIAYSWMHDKPRRFVHDEKLVVFVNDVERNVLRLYGAIVARTIEEEGYNIERLYAVVAFLRAPIHVDEACTCGGLNAIARRVGKMEDKKLIHAQQLLSLVSDNAQVLVQPRALLVGQLDGVM